MADETIYTEDDIKYFFWDRAYSTFCKYLEYKADSLYDLENVQDSFYYYELISEFYPSNWKGWWGILRCYSGNFKNFDFIDSEVYLEKLQKTAIDSEGKVEAEKITSLFESQWNEIQENRKNREAEDAKRRADNFYNMKFRRKNGVLTEYNGSDSVIIIPKDVTVIDDAAFRQNGHIERVVLHSGVTRIGKDAFTYCSHLKSINLPSSITKIGKSAFYGCENLEKIIVEGTIDTIEDDTFYGCEKLSSVTIKNGVKHIKKAFQNCKSLSTITIPKTVEDIADFCFGSCEKLTSIALLNENITIGRRAFLNCEMIENKDELTERFGEEIFR